MKGAATGISIEMRVFDGTDPVAFVVSLNLKRRHLTESQRGVIGAKLSNLNWGGHRQPTKGSIDPLVASDCKDETISVDQAASTVGVSAPTIKRARTVLREGTPEQVAAIEACEIRLRAERKAGQLLADMEKLKGRPEKASDATRLSDLGVSYDQSSKWQQLAQVPEQEFEAALTGPDKPRCTRSPPGIAGNRHRKPRPRISRGGA